jgi:hypothetical protein
MASSSVAPETAQWLNLLRESSSFVLFEGRNAGDERLEQVETVPTDSGICWIGGSLTTANGRTLDAVHLVNTDDGGQLVGSYVWVDGWHRIEDLPSHLGDPPSTVYPFDYTLAVPLAEDRFS